MESETNTLPASLMAETTRNTTMPMAMKNPSTINAIVCARGGQTLQRAKPLRLYPGRQVWHNLVQEVEKEEKEKKRLTLNYNREKRLKC